MRDESDRAARALWTVLMVLAGGLLGLVLATPIWLVSRDDAAPPQASW